MDESALKVVKFVQELLLEEDRAAITPALIDSKIDDVIAIKPRWGEGLDRDAVVDELIRRFSLWIGQDVTLTNDEGHVQWLAPERKSDWRYWQRYREWLERRLSWVSVDALDRSTDTVLGLLEDPLREGPWDRRGIVFGHVQSGKTSNYTGLICKAADAGYKVIVVLAGMHNNLRTQTQVRLEEGFLGYETAAATEAKKLLGVGEFDSDTEIHPNCATNRSNLGDFNTRVAAHLAVSPEQRPWLFVVKKNRTVLRQLLNWVQQHAADVNRGDLTGGPVDDLPRVTRLVTRLPLLVIDDEADHASVDTGEQVFDAEGNPDPEHLPKTINRLIRRLLLSFSRSAYVGYTATPFANIFIHERGATREEGKDLFPEAFIVNLAAASNYIGPLRVFGVPSENGRVGGLPLVRQISDYEIGDGTGWMPTKHVNGHLPLHEGQDALPPSLVVAINAFLLACAARRVRGRATEHSSMLVHVTRFNSVQEHVYRQVDQYLQRVRQRILRHIDDAQLLADLRALWESDFVPTAHAVALSDAGETEAIPTWGEIQYALEGVVAEVEARRINGTAKDSLDYVEREGIGLKVIAIGGDKLSRGLTLEGLCTSYFLRASRMYDTLMQMGRWFGYRPGYLDLCRLYTTSELTEWFGHIADAAEELRGEFDLMAESGATPRDYGLKVQSHPVLMVTSQLKMRAARDLMLSFSGQVLETVTFYTDPRSIEVNVGAASRLVSVLGAPAQGGTFTRDFGSTRSWDGHLWEKAPASAVIDFLRAYRTHPKAHKVNSALIAEFIEQMVAIGELTEWTVALVGGGEGDTHQLADGVTVSMLKRDSQKQPDRYSIGRLLSPRDEGIDLDPEAWLAALAMTRAAWRTNGVRNGSKDEPTLPSGPAIRSVRGNGAEGVPGHRERGLLLLYLIDPRYEWTGIASGAQPVVAFGLSFPNSTSGTKVRYTVNNVLWESEYGPSE